MFKWLFGGKNQPAAAEGTRELLVLTRTVNAPAERAFAVFVDEFQSWWPRADTFSGDALATIAIEPRIGGHAIETNKAGGRIVWGTVLAISRPSHLVLAWQIGPNRVAIDDEASASRLDVRFVEDAGKTKVVLVHRDFPRHGDGWEAYKTQMATKGWPRLMELYVKAVDG